MMLFALELRTRVSYRAPWLPKMDTRIFVLFSRDVYEGRCERLKIYACPLGSERQQGNDH